MRSLSGSAGWTTPGIASSPTHDGRFELPPTPLDQEMMPAEARLLCHITGRISGLLLDLYLGWQHLPRITHCGGALRKKQKPNKGRAFSNAMTTSAHLFGSNAPLGQIQHAARSRSSTVQCVKHPRRAGRSHINPPTPPPEGNARLRSANSRDCEILQNCCWIFPLANYGGGAVRCVQRSRTKRN